jgi:hypothetical protein
MPDAQVVWEERNQPHTDFSITAGRFPFHEERKQFGKSIRGTVLKRIPLLDNLILQSITLKYTSLQSGFGPLLGRVTNPLYLGSLLPLWHCWKQGGNNPEEG